MALPGKWCAAPIAPRGRIVRIGAFVGTALLAGVGLLRAGDAGAYFNHTVQPHETLSGIAANYGVSIDSLAGVNGIDDPDSVYAGQVIRIPGATDDAQLRFETQAISSVDSYVITRGETLGEIASAVGLTPLELALINGIVNIDLIFAGQLIAVPGSASSGGSSSGSIPVSLRSGLEHNVQFGETLSGIAAWYGVSTQSVAQANGLSDANFIWAGTTLSIPGAGHSNAPDTVEGPSQGPPEVADWFSYIIETGDTLADIAARYGLTVDALASANGLNDPDAIVSGQSLTIPGNEPGEDPVTVPIDDEPDEPRVAPGPSFEHAVQPGETLFWIAEQYDVPVEAILAANGLLDSNLVVAGSVITIPGAPIETGVTEPDTSNVGTHQVVPGEALSEIAARFGISLSELLALNGLNENSVIHPGDELLVPSARTVVNELPDADYAAILESAALEFGVSPSLIKAQAWIESGWQQGITSHADAVGIMQIIPSTAEWALLFLVPDAVNWEVDARDNARMGVAIMHHWLLQGDGDVELALAAYYQGWDAVFEVGLYEDTKAYINAVLGFVPQFE